MKYEATSIKGVHSLTNASILATASLKQLTLGFAGVVTIWMESLLLKLNRGSNTGSDMMADLERGENPTEKRNERKLVLRTMRCPTEKYDASDLKILEKPEKAEILTI